MTTHRTCEKTLPLLYIYIDSLELFRALHNVALKREEYLHRHSVNAIEVYALHRQDILACVLHS